MFDRSARIGLIGAGRLGASLAGALVRAGYDVRCISQRDPVQAEETARALGVSTASNDPQLVVDSADVVFLTVRDRELRELAASLRLHSDQALVHCSGATPLSALEPAATTGAVIGGFHPLQSFPTRESSDRFPGITVGVESSDPSLLGWLVELARALGSRPLDVTDVDRGAYHGAAFMVSGLLTTYLEAAMQLWIDAGLTRAEALHGLRPLAQQSISDIHEEEVGRSLTGPLSRGDADVVRAHLAAIGAGDEKVRRVYTALVGLQLDGVGRPTDPGDAPDAGASSPGVEALRDWIAAEGAGE